MYFLYLFSIKKFHDEHLKLQREAMEHYYSMRPERERERKKSLLLRSSFDLNS